MQSKIHSKNVSEIVWFKLYHHIISIISSLVIISKEIIHSRSRVSLYEVCTLACLSNSPSLGKKLLEFLYLFKKIIVFPNMVEVLGYVTGTFSEK